MARAPKQRNEKLLRMIKACHWSYDACAAAVRAIARANNDDDLRSCDRSHVGHWVAGDQPSGLTPRYIAEAVSRRLDQPIWPTDLGFLTHGSLDADLDGLDWWRHDAVTDLVTVGRADLERRAFALKALYSLAALAVPLGTWQEIADRGRRAQGGRVAVGRGEIAAVRQPCDTCGNRTLHDVDRPRVRGDRRPKADNSRDHQGGGFALVGRPSLRAGMDSDHPVHRSGPSPRNRAGAARPRGSSRVGAPVSPVGDDAKPDRETPYTRADRRIPCRSSVCPRPFAGCDQELEPCARQPLRGHVRPDSRRREEHPYAAEQLRPTSAGVRSALGSKGRRIPPREDLTGRS